MEEGSIVITGTPSDVAWERARLWMQVATRHECRKLIAQVMTGLELLWLHDAHKVRRGQPKKELSQNGSILFKSLIERELGIPASTGRRWMRMATVVKKKLAGMAVPEVVAAAVEGAPAAWSAEHAEQIVKFVDQLTEGRKQSDLLPSEKEGRKRGMKPKVSRPESERAAGKAVTPTERLLEEYSQALPSDLDLQGEMTRLETVLRLCREWLMTELGQRDIALLRASFKALRQTSEISQNWSVATR